MNKFTEKKQSTVSINNRKILCGLLSFFGFFLHLPTDKPIIVCNCTKLFHETKTDGTDPTYGFEVKKLL